MATSLNEWINEILPSIPNAPAPAIYSAVRKAARTFCEKTHLWTYTLPLIDVVADTAAYALHIPDGSAGDDGIDLNAELIGVPHDGVRYKEDGKSGDFFATLTCRTEDELDAESGSWRYRTAPSPSSWYMDNVDKQIHLVSTPENDSDEGLEVKVILKPDNSCSTLPDFLYDDYLAVITAGALAELFGAKGMPWYDLDEQAKNGIEFRNGVNNAKIKKFTGPTNKPLNIAMRYFA